MPTFFVILLLFRGEPNIHPNNWTAGTCYDDFQDRSESPIPGPSCTDSMLHFRGVLFPKLRQALKIGHPKRKLVFQPCIFRCYVSFREGSYLCLRIYFPFWIPPIFRGFSFFLGSEIPWNLVWFIGILIMNYYTPYGSIQLGGISSPILNQPPRVGDHTTQLQRDHTTQLYGCFQK